MTFAPELMASWRAQFPDADVDACVRWASTVPDIENPEAFIGAVLAKGKFAKGSGRGSGASARGGQGATADSRPRGSLGADGGWNRYAESVSRHERAAREIAESVAQRCSTPADGAAYLAQESEYRHWYESVLHLWSSMATPEGWLCAPCSNTAQVWIKEACAARYLRPDSEQAPAGETEALLLRDWVRTG